MVKKYPFSGLPPKVFISYSHADREFVQTLATSLTEKGIAVWWDGWEIKVGDSLIRKIEEGLSSSSYFCVVLTPDSVSSAWVQEELEAAMMRQLRERRVIVLPILLRDCRLPAFLTGKRYANFSEDYDKGFKELIAAIEPPDVLSHSRTEVGEYFNDYAMDWGVLGERFLLEIDITSHGPNLPYAIRCHISALATEALSERLNAFIEAGFPWASSSMLLINIEDVIANNPPIIYLEGDREATQEYRCRDLKHDTGIDLTVSARRLGQDPGQDILYEWGSIVAFAARRHREGIASALTPDEKIRFEKWRRENPIQQI